MPSSPIAMPRPQNIDADFADALGSEQAARGDGEAPRGEAGARAGGRDHRRRGGAGRDLGRLSLPAAGLAVVCCALWGANAVAVKFTVEHIPPIGCAALRFSLSLVLLVGWCRLAGVPIVPRRQQWFPALLLGGLVFLQISLFNWGTRYTLAGRSSVFINVHPLVVALLAWLWLREAIGVWGVVGLAAAAAGVATLFEHPRDGSEVTLAGDLAVLASGCLLGVNMVVSKRWLRLVRPSQFVLWESAVSVPLFFAYSGAVEGFETYRFTAQAIVGVLYQGIVITVFCFLVWLALLRRHRAAQLAAFGFLTPFFGIGFGWLLRDEALRPSLLLGCGLVALGLWLVTRPRGARLGPTPAQRDLRS